MLHSLLARCNCIPLNIVMTSNNILMENIEKNNNILMENIEINNESNLVSTSNTKNVTPNNTQPQLRVQLKKY